MRNITPFMLDLHKELKRVRDIADVTASQYIRILYNLNSNKAFINLAWVKHIESLNLRLSEYAESTQRTMLSALVSTLSLYSEKSSYKKIYSFWYNRMMEKAAEHTDTGVKTEKQEKNWLSWDVVLGHEKRLKAESESVLAQKSINENGWNILVAYMVLSLFTKFPPRRNLDYQLMKVAKTEKQTNTEDNWYIQDVGKFTFNKYKTASTHGTQSFDVPSDLVAVINLYLSRHPLAGKKPFQFLVKYDGSEFKAVNSITRILNKIFGKNVGASMLRHIYLSNKYDVAEMEADAEAMGHTSGMQHEYLKKD